MSARLGGVSWPAAAAWSSGGELAMAARPRAVLSNSSFLASSAPSGIVRLKKSRGRHLSASPKQRQQLVVSSKAKNLGQAEFDEVVLKSELPVLVDFWAEWCGPCKLIAPIIDWAAENYSDKLKVYKVNTEANPELVKRYKPYGLPTLVLFKDGKIVPRSRREGAISKDKLRSYLDEQLGTVTTA